MADSTSVDVDIGIFWIVFLVLIVLFWGDPDLHDALLHHFGDVPMPEPEAE